MHFCWIKNFKCATVSKDKVFYLASSANASVPYWYLVELLNAFFLKLLLRGLIYATGHILWMHQDIWLKPSEIFRPGHEKISWCVVVHAPRFQQVRGWFHACNVRSDGAISRSRSVICVVSFVVFSLLHFSKESLRNFYIQKKLNFCLDKHVWMSIMLKALFQQLTIFTRW